jgi:hypothetical protein
VLTFKFNSIKESKVNAFPQNNDRVVASLSIANSQGMTLRDYFAAKAMQGFNDRVGSNSDQRWFDDIAKGAYRMADAMMEARNAAQ